MDPRWKREADLIVVGGGLVALLATAAAAESGMRVIQYRIADRPPMPDHEWLHSGLLLDTDLPTARLIRVWGKNMLRTFGIKASSEAGVFLAHTAAAAQELRRSAAQLALQIQELTTAEAALMAGPQFSESRAYAVADALFDKVALASVAERVCVSGGAEIVQLARGESIALLPSDTAAGGVLVQTARELAESAVTVLADGAMIPALIEPLGIRHPLVVDRSPVISMAQPAGLKAGLLVDLDRQLSYVRHDWGGPASASYTIARARFNAAGDGRSPITDLLPFEVWPSQPRPGPRTIAVASEVEVAHVQWPADGGSGQRSNGGGRWSEGGGSDQRTADSGQRSGGGRWPVVSGQAAEGRRQGAADDEGSWGNGLGPGGDGQESVVSGQGQAKGSDGQRSVVGGQGGRPVLAWVHDFKSQGFPGLVAAFTDVANLALWTANQVMKRMLKVE